MVNWSYDRVLVLVGSQSKLPDRTSPQLICSSIAQTVYILSYLGIIDRLYLGDTPNYPDPLLWYQQYLGGIKQ
jgi:hypothetical protein